ncbi:MAG: hypothetical protein WBW37_02945, partial [Methyloceanibacter sp.]
PHRWPLAVGELDASTLEGFGYVGGLYTMPMPGRRVALKPRKKAVCQVGSAWIATRQYPHGKPRESANNGWRLIVKRG